MITKIKRNLKIRVYVRPPINQEQNESVTLYFELEKNFIPGSDKIWGLDYNTEGQLKFNPPESVQSFSFERKITDDKLNAVTLDKMPGFIWKWYYNQKLHADQYDSDTDLPYFRR